MSAEYDLFNNINIAKRKIVRIGQSPKLLPDKRRERTGAVKHGKIRPVDAILVLGVSKTTFFCIIKSIREYTAIFLSLFPFGTAVSISHLEK